MKEKLPSKPDSETLPLSARSLDESWDPPKLILLESEGGTHGDPAGSCDGGAGDSCGVAFDPS